MTTLDLQVAASTDDAFENTGGNMLVDLTQGNVDADTKFFGFRFQGVTIPPGATIDAAYLELYIYNANLDEPLHTIYAEDGASPAAFTTSNGDISSRTGTTATVTWDNGDTGATGFVQTPSLVSVIQELVDTYDYSGGAPVALIVQGNANAARDLGVMMYDGEPTQAPKLHIEYTAAAGVTVSAAVGSVGASGPAATVLATTTVQASVAAVAAPGQTASVRLGAAVTVLAVGGVVAISGISATVNAATTAPASSAAAVMVSGPGATIASGAVLVTAGPGVALVGGTRAVIETARYLYDLAVGDGAAYAVELGDEAGYSLALADGRVYSVALEDGSRG